MTTGIGIALEEGRLWAVAVRRGRAVWAAESTYANEADLAEALASLAASRPRGTRTLSVALGASLVTVKSVEGLPPLKPRDLAAHVQLKSRRYFLQNGVPLVTGVAERTTDDGLPVLAAAAEAPLIEAVVAGTRQAGLDCRAIVAGVLLPAPPDNVLPDNAGLRLAYAAATARRYPIALTTDSWRHDQRSRQLRLTRRLAVIAAISLGLGLAAQIAGPAWRLQRDSRQLSRLDARVAGALAVRAELDAVTEALRVAASEQTQRSGTARFLADLARALPDSVFLTALELRGDTGTVSGYAARAAAAVAAIQRLSGVERAALEGAVVQDLVGDAERERFTVRFVWRR